MPDPGIHDPYLAWLDGLSARRMGRPYSNPWHNEVLNAGGITAYRWFKRGYQGHSCPPPQILEPLGWTIHPIKGPIWTGEPS